MYSPKVQKIWKKYCRIACLGNLKTFASHSDTYTYVIGPKRMNFYIYTYIFRSRNVVFRREKPNPIPIEKEMGAHTIRIKCSIVQFLFFMAPSLYCRVLNNG